MASNAVRRIFEEDFEDWNTRWTPSSPEVPNVFAVELLRTSRLTSTGKAFLPKYVDLEAVDLRPIRHLTVIGDRFLYECKSLITIDLGGFTNPIASVGTHFLCKCSGLLAIDLTPLSQVTSLGSCFLYGCTSLVALDLAPLANVTCVGDYFLYGVNRIHELDLTPLSRLGVVPSHFLRECRALKRIDTAPLRHIRRIGDCFLEACGGISDIDLKNFSNVCNIGSNFLAGCFGLTFLDLRCLMSIQSVGEFFLHDCSGLRRIIIGDDQRCLIAAAERSGLAGIMEIVPAHPLAKELRDQLVSVDIRVSAATNDMLQAKEELAGAQGLLSAKAAEWAAGRAEVEKLRGKVEERDAKIKDLDESRVAIYNAFMPLRKGVLAIRDELRHSAFVEATGLGEAALTMELRGLIRATHEPKNADGRSYPVDGPDGMVVTL